MDRHFLITVSCPGALLRILEFLRKRASQVLSRVAANEKISP